jgi:hypothetical protein
MGTITVLAGGWSARAYLDRLEGVVIGVNDAALCYPADIAVSMDRLWTEHRWDQLKRRAKPAWIRRSALKNIPERDPAVRPAWLKPFVCDHTSTVFSEDDEELHGTHSGFCALNLAYVMRPQRLVLVGFDMSKGPKGEAHWFPPYEWAPQGATTSGKFKAWAAQFDDAAKKFKAAGVAVEVWGQTAIPAFGKRAA